MSDGSHGLSYLGCAFWASSVEMKTLAYPRSGFWLRSQPKARPKTVSS